MKSVTPRILIVEDQPRERSALSRVLRTEGFKVVAVGSLAEAMQPADAPPDMVISDLKLGTSSGMDLLRHWRINAPSIPFVIMTAFGDVSSAVMAMKLGAADYLTKPLDPEELLVLIRRHLPSSLPSTPDLDISSAGLGRMIGQSALMKSVFEKVKKVANSDSLVLITGESGTGKELVAAAIHEHSSRRSGPYVAVNIAAVPEGLVEAELFGVRKGAFTGAVLDRDGRFAIADKGTLFIDEVGDFPLALQPKLLRVLEELKVCPVGSDSFRSVDVRVVAATSRNLSKLAANQTFRVDLMHRLQVLTIELPPLRARPEDIPALVSHFLQESAQRHRRPSPTFTTELTEFFVSYDWPGNVRQLRNAIENLVVMGRDTTLTMDDLPHFLSGGPIAHTVSEPATSLQDVERIAILGALDRSHGNRSHAAMALGISVRTLQRKLKQWGYSASE